MNFELELTRLSRLDHQQVSLSSLVDHDIEIIIVLLPQVLVPGTNTVTSIIGYVKLCIYLISDTNLIESIIGYTSSRFASIEVNSLVQQLITLSHERNSR